MSLPSEDVRELADVAIVAATEAGRMIAASRPAAVEHKATGDTLAAQVVTEVDRRSEALILARLEPTQERFGLGLLTEERDDDHSRLTTDHYWCIDPLDGTLPFIEGIPGSAVSIALVAVDGTPLIGVAHDPHEDVVVHAIAGTGAWRDAAPWRPMPTDEAAVLTVFADRSFVADRDHAEVLEALSGVAHERGLDGVDLRVGAGAVMNALGVLTHAPACYFKFAAPSGGGSLWDFAATACVFGEVGATATDIHGGPLDLNRADSTFMNHRGVLFATDEQLASSLRSLSANKG